MMPLQFESLVSSNYGANAASDSWFGAP
jgi:hypothetical protein